MPTTFRGQLLAIAAGALVIRFLYVALLVANNTGFDDRQYFHDNAINIAAGRGYIDPFLFDFLGRVTPSAGHPPLWPFVLSVPAFLGLDSWTFQQFVCAFIGAVVVFAVGLLGYEVGGRRIGLIAAGLAAIYPTLIARDGSLLSETLYGLLIVLSMLAAYRVLKRPTERGAALMGGMIGLAALTRGEGWLFLVFMAIPVCWFALPPGLRRRRLIVVTVAATALTIAPWTVRNWIVFGEPVFISLNEASVIGGANCAPVYSGPEIGTWNITCLAPRNPDLSETAQHAIWRKDGLRYARHHLNRLPAVMTVRVLRTYDLWAPSKQAHGDGRDYTVAVLGTWSYLLLLLPLGIYGAVLLRRRRHTLLILGSPVFVVTLSAALSWGLPRERHPLDLSLLVLTAIAVSAIAAGQQTRATSSRAA